MAEDIVDMIATALQLADLACSVITNCVGCCRGIVLANQERRRMSDEVYSLKKIVEDIQAVLEKSKESAHSPENIGTIEHEFAQTRSLLTEAENYTKPSQAHGLRRLEWVFKKPATKVLIDRIQERRQTLQLVLQAMS